MSIIINEIKGDGIILKCNKPMLLNYNIENGYLIFDDEVLDIYLCCKNEQELFDEFCEFIISDYFTFVKDEILTDKAKEYRKILQSKFTEIIEWGDK